MRKILLSTTTSAFYLQISVESVCLFVEPVDCLISLHLSPTIVIEGCVLPRCLSQSDGTSMGLGRDGQRIEK